MSKYLFGIILIFLSFCSKIIYSYKINGVEFGECAWYGGYYSPGHFRENGVKTASGEIFSRWRFTASHRTLPFGTIVRIINELNNASVEVRINDRGPNYAGRILDMTRRAFFALDGVEESISFPCKIEEVTPEVRSSEER